MKNLIIVALLFQFIFLEAQLNIDSGLVACYPLNGQAVEMIFGNNGSVNLVSDTINKNGKPASAMAFHGTSTSFIELPENALKPNSISFSAWIRPSNSLNAVSYIVFTRNSTATGSTNNEAYALAIMTGSGGKKIRAIKSNSTQTYWLDNTTLLNNNNWYHVCFTMDNSDMRIYLNGVQEGTLAASGFIAYQSMKKVYLGGSNEITNQKPFAGAIDNVRFYDRVLNSGEVLQLYQNDPACFTVTQNPVASFSVNAPCVNQASSLKDGSSNYPENWFWQASNGVVQNPYNPETTILFSNSGTQTISLIVSNDLGSDTVVKSVTIYPAPSINAVVTPSMVGAGHQTTITASGATTYTWTWNNYILQGQSINLTFTAVGSNQTVTVIGVDSVGCIGKDTLNIHVWSISSVQEQNRDRVLFSLFPNPFNTELFIKDNSQQQSNSELIIIDVNGREVKRIALGSENKINTSDLASGIYHLQILKNNEVVYKTKVLKE